jgi:hypothetical protein
MKQHHIILYLIEFLIIGLGFVILLSFSLPFYNQLFILGLILSLYIIVGLLHHRTHHDISIAVVLEYILISALAFALFVFLNVSRL